MTSLTPIWPLQLALENAIRGDTALNARLTGRKIYSSLADRNKTLYPYPYVVFTTTGNENKHLFGTKGSQTSQEIQIAALNKKDVAEIFDDLYRVLDGVRLTVTDHTVVHGTLALLLTIPEEDTVGERGIAKYTVHTHRG